MGVLIEYLIVFAVCSTAGWVLEVIYRSKNAKKLINPGLLSGCCLPIYGCGGASLYFMCQQLKNGVESPLWRAVVAIAVGSIVMTVIELVAGLLAMKCYNSRLWDYSDKWGNYKGIICPEFSLYWGICCACFYFLLEGALHTLATTINSNIAIILMIGMYYGIFFVDFAMSLDLLQKIKERAVKLKQIISIEELKLLARESFEKHFPKRKSAFMFNLNAAIKQYFSEQMEQLDHIKQDISNKINK